MLREAPLFVRAARGEVSFRDLALYLYNVRFLITHTPGQLKRALGIAKQLGDPVLEAFFTEKIGEEDGHDRWADDDLASLPIPRDQLGALEILPSMTAVIANIERTIDEHPACYLSYLLVGEYFTVRVGPIVLENLERLCGIGRQHVTAVDKHVELDKDHVVDDFSIIDRVHARAPELADQMRDSLVRSLDVMEAFLSEVSARAAEPHA